MSVLNEFPFAINALHTVASTFNCSTHSGIDYATCSSAALQLIIEGFRIDGYELNRISENGHLHPPSTFTHTMLRRSLSAEGGQETATGPDLVLNIILVFICVLCAGFASGLTQV